MDNFYLSAITREIERRLADRSLSRISMAAAELQLDFGLAHGQVLVVSLDPSSPALWLGSGRSMRDADSQATHQFLAALRKGVAGSKLTLLSKDPLDRIVHLGLERYDVGGMRETCSLTLLLTGRSTNAFLADSAGNVEAVFRERADVADDSIARTTLNAMVAPLEPPAGLPRLESGLSEATTEDEICSTHFGPGSGFGPQLEREFRARCGTQSPFRAFRSLVAELLAPKPRGFVYSSIPVGEIGTVPMNLKTDLLLSHIRLVHARDLLSFEFDSLSEAADAYYAARAAVKTFQSEFNSLRTSLTTQIRKHNGAIRRLEADRARFDEPEQFKRSGDLILANLATAKVGGEVVRVVDYYDPEQREVDIEIGGGVTLQQAASRYFARYQKAKRGLSAVTSRLEAVKSKVEPLNRLLAELESHPDAETVNRLTRATETHSGKKTPKPAARKKRAKTGADIGRRFMSTDGYEIVVGRKDSDNDWLTFRVARSQDIWLHAADYPGSHVVIRNPNRKTVPQTAIQEAAELAAFFSQAKRDAKVSVHYAEKKFVTKPPRAKPGLVRLSSFKTILVAPRQTLERIE